MKKKYYIVGIFLLTSMIIAGGIFLTSYLSNKKSPTDQPQVPQDAKQLPANFILIPSTYQLTESESKVLETIPSEVEILRYSADSTKIEGEQAYSKCQTELQATKSNTANQSLNEWYLSANNCKDNDTEKVKIYEFTCEEITPQCFDFISQTTLTGANNYLYLPQDPLLFAGKWGSLKIENPYINGYIFTWNPLFIGTIEQKGYSLEILRNDQSMQREYSTGKVLSNVRGAYYFPTSEPKSQTNEYTAVLRLWLGKENGINTPPFVVKQVFTIQTPQTGTQPSLIPAAQVAEMAWIPDWGHTAGIESLAKNPKKWHTVSPVWYVPNADGTLKAVPRANDATIFSITRKNNIRLIPTISLFDADVLTEILNKHMDSHIAAIVTATVSGNYDGIDLDYESTYAADRELLVTFISKLSTELHARGKILSFTALPKIDDREIYAFLPQTHQAQDWAAIGQNVDEFRIMAYDYTGQGSLRPGPLSPMHWDEALIQYAISKMPAEKIVLALPLYSHAWPKPKVSDQTGALNDQPLDSGLQKNTASWQHDDIAYIKDHSKYYREKYDTWNKEVYSELSYNGVERIQYYLDRKAINERIELAKKYRIKGVCYWRIGGEAL